MGSLRVAYLCRGRRVKRAIRLCGCQLCVGGGALSLLERPDGMCAGTPRLISVRDPALWVGDMMVDGVIPLGEALRPLSLSGPSTGR
jgi:hypothetical protein